MGLWKGVEIKGWAQSALVSGKFLAGFCSPKVEEVVPKSPRDQKAGWELMEG